MDPPPGVKSNFTNPKSYRVQSLAMSTSLLIIVTSVFTVWIFTKVKVGKKLYVEDYIIAIAFVSLPSLEVSIMADVNFLD